MKESFLERVRATIARNRLFSIEDEAVLVGVSGGVDSMVLLDSLRALGCRVAVAHCNFCLRGAESDGDQSFVEDYALKHGIPIHICSFATADVARRQKISIEMAARNLRYDWFETLCRLHRYTCIAIAHNQNDSVETFFINLLRSSGLRGLQGIPVKNGSIVRPLLGIPRCDIEQYARERGIAYRTDSSNLTNDYVRNKIRNIILPELKKISPSCIDAISASMGYLQSSYVLCQERLEAIKSHCCRITERGLEIDERKLVQQSEPQTVIFEILRPYGFNGDTISQIHEVLTQQSGKTFESAEYTAVHDRDTLYIVKRRGAMPSPVSILLPQGEYTLGETTVTLSLADASDCEILRDKSIAMLDYDTLSFPLTLRVWQPGDVFSPFGMRGKKKVSDFLINEKVPLMQKKSVAVLVSGGTIAWVVGMRISQNFAITERTKKILVVQSKHQR